MHYSKLQCACIRELGRLFVVASRGIVRASTDSSATLRALPLRPLTPNARCCPVNLESAASVVAGEARLHRLQDYSTKLHQYYALLAQQEYHGKSRHVMKPKCACIRSDLRALKPNLSGLLEIHKQRILVWLWSWGHVASRG